MLKLLRLGLVIGMTAAYAEDDLEAVPDVPEPPSKVESGEPMEPEVTIIRRGKDTIEEYRVHNRLYMVKVKPSIGPDYYLVDTDGDGEMDVRRTTLTSDMEIPQWVLFSW